MALSDEDLAAIGHVRGLLDAMPRDDRRNLERVLALAGEPVPEPAQGTLWLDPVHWEVYGRPDSDAYPWMKTDTTRYRWDEFDVETRRRLVQLARKDGTDGTE